MVRVYTPTEQVFTMRNKFAKEADSAASSYKYDEDRHIYTPYMVTRDTKIPDMSNLISMPKRFYLKPIPDLSEYEKDRFDSINESVDAIQKDMESQPVLDLGTASLQRIVTNMKGIKFETKESRFSKDAARLAGLKSYTEFTNNVHTMHDWSAPNSLYKSQEQPYGKNSSMYVGIRGSIMEPKISKSVCAE